MMVEKKKMVIGGEEDLFDEWACSSHSFRSYPLNSGHGTGFKDVFNSKTGLAHRSLYPARFSAVSDGRSGGSGGTCGVFGGSGDGNSGGGSSAGGDGGSNWSFFSWYLALLAKYPMLTKAVTSALLTFIGDIICQVVIDQAPSLDVKRTFVFTLLGLVLVGPTLHFWYLHPSKLVPLPGVSGTLVCLLLDQFLFAPTFIGVFLSTLVTLEGRPSQVVPKLQQEWFSAVLANWKLWIPFQFLNFLFVPQQFQNMLWKASKKVSSQGDPPEIGHYYGNLASPIEEILVLNLASPRKISHKTACKSLKKVLTIPSSIIKKSGDAYTKGFGSY
ncbi:hypothetical protein QYF36_001723 [Acer negundo]|nr:hypothetical protein QYF36_001723 [Acer negundo]